MHVDWNWKSLYILRLSTCTMTMWEIWLCLGASPLASPHAQQTGNSQPVYNSTTMAPIRRYLRITKYSVLECRIYLDNPALADSWLLNPRTPVLPRVIESVRPLVLPKLREENHRSKGKGGSKKKGVKDVVVEGLHAIIHGSVTMQLTLRRGLWSVNIPHRDQHASHHPSQAETFSGYRQEGASIKFAKVDGGDKW